MIKSHGNINSPLWFIFDHSYEMSEKMEFVFNRFIRESGINTEHYCCSLDASGALDCNNRTPAIICPVGSIATVKLCPETRKKQEKKNVQTEASLEKWAGSLLTSPNINWPHYCIPTVSPDSIIANWEYRFIHTQIDLGHVREELDSFRHNQMLQAYTKREIITEPDFSVLRDVIRSLHSEKIIAMDIETIRPKRESIYYKRMPGELYIIGLANSPNFAISFCPWKYEPWQQLQLFRLLDELFTKVPQVGQNYFTFDTHFTEAYGFTHCLDKCEDTMLRHQILWPELPHKLQFLCKQYTRQPYYKDEGQGWSPKNLKRYMNYNGLDCCITMETFLGQEEEFNDRPYLR